MNTPKISWWQRLGQLLDHFLARWPMMKKPTINWALLHRYLEGKATEAERRAVDQWMDKAGSDDIRAFLSDHSDPELEELQADVLFKLELGIPPTYRPDQQEAPDEPVHDLRVVLWSRSNRLKAAAAAGLILGGSLIGWQAGRMMGEHRVVAALGTIQAPVGHPPVQASLLDSSQVILSPGSTLRYSATFGKQSREVYLEGEAYFAVRHDASRPFRVHAGDLIAEDLGTEFVVRAYPEDQHGRVIVREGQVGINGTTISPGEIGQLNSNGTVKVEYANIPQWFAWTSGSLRFSGMSFLDAMPKLSRWYDVEFRLADPAAKKAPLAGQIPSLNSDGLIDDRVVHDALEQLRFALGFEVTREGRVVTIRTNTGSPP